MLETRKNAKKTLGFYNFGKKIGYYLKVARKTNDVEKSKNDVEKTQRRKRKRVIMCGLDYDCAKRLRVQKKKQNDREVERQRLLEQKKFEQENEEKKLRSENETLTTQLTNANATILSLKQTNEALQKENEILREELQTEQKHTLQNINKIPIEDQLPEDFLSGANNGSNADVTSTSL